MSTSMSVRISTNMSANMSAPMSTHIVYCPRLSRLFGWLTIGTVVTTDDKKTWHWSQPELLMWWDGMNMQLWLVYIVIAYAVMACIAMAYTVMAYVVMALYSYGLYSYGLYSNGLCSYGTIDEKKTWHWSQPELCWDGVDITTDML